MPMPMPVKKEICRNFARGSCQFGQRCRYLHVNPQQQQQQQPHNASQSPHHKPNPYGFGVQNNSQRPTQSRPFDNTWNRFSPAPAPARPHPPPQSQNHSQPTNHECTDPESCRRIFVDDFEHERPLWKLTCYGHWKNAPCDIVGDISYEELRMAAYDDAKRGLSMQSIVDRERNLLNSKLIEFENLCKPGTFSSNSRLSDQNSLLGTGPNAFLQKAQANFPTSVSSFSQLGTSLNTGIGSRAPAPLNNAFVQPNVFASFSQTSSAFGTKNLSSESQVGSPFASTSVFGSSSFTRAENNPISTSALSTQVPTATNNPSFGLLMDLNSNTNLNRPSIGEAPPPGDVRAEDSVWFKNTWNPGEIPEEAPPDAVCH